MRDAAYEERTINLEARTRGWAWVYKDNGEVHSPFFSTKKEAQDWIGPGIIERIKE